MEMELNGLIEKLKKDGVEQAEKEKSDIVAAAGEEANKIIADAGQVKKALIEQARIESDNFKRNAEKAVQQSARDVLLTLRGRVTEFCARIVKKDVSKELAGGVLKDVIVEAIRNFRKDGDLDIELLVNGGDRERLEKAVFGELSAKMKEHIKFKESKSVETGFRIGEKGKDSYYDFTDEAIAEAFIKYINPKLVEILDLDLGLGKKEKQ